MRRPLLFAALISAVCTVLPPNQLHSQIQQLKSIGNFYFVQNVDSGTDSPFDSVVNLGEDPSAGSLNLAVACNALGVAIAITTGLMGGDHYKSVHVSYSFDNEKLSKKSRWRQSEEKLGARASAKDESRILEKLITGQRLSLTVKDPQTKRELVESFNLYGAKEALMMLPCYTSAEKTKKD